MTWTEKGPEILSERPKRITAIFSFSSLYFSFTNSLLLYRLKAPRWMIQKKYCLTKEQIRLSAMQQTKASSSSVVSYASIQHLKLTDHLSLPFSSFSFSPCAWSRIAAQESLRHDIRKRHLYNDLIILTPPPALQFIFVSWISYQFSSFRFFTISVYLFSISALLPYLSALQSSIHFKTAHYFVDLSTYMQIIHACIIPHYWLKLKKNFGT